MSQLWTASLQLSARLGFASTAKSHFSQEHGLPRVGRIQRRMEVGVQGPKKAIKVQERSPQGPFMSQHVPVGRRGSVGPLRQFGMVLCAPLCLATIPQVSIINILRGQLHLGLQRTQPATPWDRAVVSLCWALEPHPLSHCSLTTCNHHTGASRDVRAARQHKANLLPPTPQNAGQLIFPPGLSPLVWRK